MSPGDPYGLADILEFIVASGLFAGGALLAWLGIGLFFLPGHRPASIGALVTAAVCPLVYFSLHSWAARGGG